MPLYLRHTTKPGCDFEVVSYDPAAHTAVVRTPDGTEHFDHAFYPAKLKLVGYSLTPTIPKSFGGKDA